MGVSHPNHHNKEGCSIPIKGFFFFIPSLALTTCFCIFFYISITSKLVDNQYSNMLVLESLLSSSGFYPLTDETIPVSLHNSTHIAQPPQLSFASKVDSVKNMDVLHDRDLFMEDYKEMNRTFKIYSYPHTVDDPFANVFLPVTYDPSGNYASESYFKKVLMKSHFLTKDPTKAHLFYLPFSISNMRHDPRIDVPGIPDFVRDYIANVSAKYPFWNQTDGADHFYVACHSIGKTATYKQEKLRNNAIQLVCSSNYFVTGYLAHKDASMPQIWPRPGNPPNVPPAKRKQLAFFAGAMNSPMRQKVLEAWENDTEIFVHDGRLKTPYADALIGSKYCLHVKGFEVNTARVADSLYHGCVPVIIADHYDLPFTDVLNWPSFSVVVHSADIPSLKTILKAISYDEYLALQSNVLKVRKHFQWHNNPADFDAFHMALYELWIRRSSGGVGLAGSSLD